ncbi:ATP-binding protein [Streptomyces sp. NPDC004436]
MPLRDIDHQGTPARRFPTGLDLLFQVRERRGHSHEVGEVDAVLPSRARRLCSAWLRLADEEEATDLITLAATELLTNAIRYGTASTIRFRLEPAADLLTLSVHDGNPQQPHIQAADLMAERGRGMQIVDQLVRSAGGDLGFSEDGTTTWCTFPISKERRHA